MHHDEEDQPRVLPSAQPARDDDQERIRAWRDAQYEFAFLLHVLATEQIDYLLAQVRCWALEHRRLSLPGMMQVSRDPNQPCSNEDLARVQAEQEALAAVLAALDRDQEAADALLATTADALWRWVRAWRAAYPEDGAAYPEVLRGWMDDSTLDRLAWCFRPEPPGAPQVEWQKVA